MFPLHCTISSWEPYYSFAYSNFYCSDLTKPIICPKILFDFFLDLSIPLGTVRVLHFEFNVKAWMSRVYIIKGINSEEGEWHDHELFHRELFLWFSFIYWEAHQSTSFPLGKKNNCPELPLVGRGENDSKHRRIFISLMSFPHFLILIIILISH